MVNVNKKYINAGLRDRAWRCFLKELGSPESVDVAISKLRAFLTPAEITMLEKRLAIPILLQEKASYREIGRMLDVTPKTISFLKHHLIRKPVTHRV